MAALAQGVRNLISAAVQRIWSDRRETCAFTKADLQAAVDATDTWIDTNAAAFNTALPVAFRTNATQAQKTYLFCLVALKRAGETVPRES